MFSKYLGSKPPIIIITALLFAPIFTVTSLYAPYLRAKQRSEFSPIWEQSGISLLSLFVLLIYSKFDDITLWSSIAVFVGLSCALAILPMALRSQKRQRWYSVARGSKFFGFQQIAQYLSTTLMLVICGLLFSEEALANLSTAQRLSLLISFPLIVMNAVTASKFASLFAAKQILELKVYAWRTAETTTILALIVTIPLLFFSEELLYNLFGPPFTEAAFDLKILTCAQFFNVITGSSLTLLNMSGHGRISMQIALATAVFAISLVAISLVLHEVRFLGAILASSLQGLRAFLCDDRMQKIFLAFTLAFLSFGGLFIMLKSKSQKITDI